MGQSETVDDILNRLRGERSRIKVSAAREPVDVFVVNARLTEADREALKEAWARECRG